VRNDVASSRPGMIDTSATPMPVEREAARAGTAADRAARRRSASTRSANSSEMRTARIVPPPVEPLARVGAELVPAASAAAWYATPSRRARSNVARPPAYQRAARPP
jgi:hypothetical protein